MALAKNMKSIIFSFFLLLNSAFASGEIRVPADSITIRSAKHKLELTLTEQAKKPLMVSISHEGKKFSIDKDVMALFQDVNLRSIQILAHTPTGELPKGWLKEHGYIIQFHYGDSKLHGTKGNEVEVYSVGRIHCIGASYIGLERFIPEGQFKNRWKLYMPMIFEEGDGFNGTAEGIKCP